MHTDRLFTVCYLPLAFFTLLLSTVIHNERTARRRVLVSFGLFFLTVLAVPLVRAQPAPQTVCIFRTCRIYVG